MLADVFPVTELIQGLGRLSSSMQGETHHQLPVAPPSLSEFSEELMKLLAQKPELMHKTSPIVFERVVGAMFKRFNMDVAFTQQTCDGGYDIVAIEESRHTRNQYIIEVKRFHPTRKVGVALVQRLYGVKTANSATKAFLVTSSSFSAQARKWAQQHAWELDLKDYGDLVKWLRLHWGNG
jgi:restriction system protein